MLASRPNGWRVGWFSLLAACLVAAPLAATDDAAASRFPLTRSSRLVLEGNTNLHRFRCTAAGLEGAIEFAAAREPLLAALIAFESGHPAPADSAGAPLPPPRFELRLPIVQLDCASRGIERDLRQALDAEHYPHIRFELTGVEQVRHAAASESITLLDLAGVLTLREVSRPVRTTITARPAVDGNYRLTGQLPLRMTDFGIPPPVALFGLIRVDDSLLLRFDVEVAVGAR